MLNRMAMVSRLGLFAALTAGTASMAVAQQAAPSPAPAKPTPTQSAAPAAQAIVQPLPGQATAPTPVPLPTLTPAQSAELRQLLTAAIPAQGLRRIDAKIELPADPAGLVRAALDYAHAVHNGRLEGDDFDPNWDMHPPAYDPRPDFALAVQQNRITDWFQSLPPPYVGYEGLKAGLKRYRDIERSGGWKPLAPKNLAKGDTGPEVTALRQRLAVEDPLVLIKGTSFDDELVEALKRAQQRLGVPLTGKVDAATREALNVPVRSRIHQIMANMERWRWLPRYMPDRRIQVNIATAKLTVFNGDTPLGSMRVVAGKPSSATPMLSSTIESIVINPPWNVPQSIASRELWPKEKRNPGYLARHGFKVIPLSGGGNRLQQQPGQSALGKFKFDFANKFAVYLHDTPVQSAFSRFDRLASHGCVRLSKPHALANLLLQGSTDWTPDAVNAALAKGDTVRAPLPQPWAVYLLYWTAFASPDGVVSFREDPYDWDKELAGKIEARADAEQVAARTSDQTGGI